MLATLLPDQIDAHRLLMKVASGRSTETYKNDQKIYNQGEAADFVYFVQDGQVRLTVTVLDAGPESVIGVAQAGQFFGEACLHDSPVRIATATAIGECRITAVTKAAILSAILERPKFAKLFIEYLSEHNSWVQKDMLDHLVA